MGQRPFCVFKTQINSSLEWLETGSPTSTLLQLTPLWAIDGWFVPSLNKLQPPIKSSLLSFTFSTRALRPGSTTYDIVGQIWSLASTRYLSIFSVKQLILQPLRIKQTIIHAPKAKVVNEGSQLLLNLQR